MDSMTPYVGVLIEQSLADHASLRGIEVLCRQRDPHGAWVFLLVRVVGAQERETFAGLQASLRKDGNWYTHFFRGEELVVIYRDATFTMSIDPTTWGAAVEHGRRLGIPEDQLDFVPHTPVQVEARFGAGALG
jgi:hypothetical protein